MPFKDFSTYGNSINFSVFNTSEGVPSISETMELTHQELKPCPFCGADAEVIKQEAHNVYMGFAVRCKECFCSTAAEYEGKTVIFGYPYREKTFSDVLKSVVNKWNTRAAEEYEGSVDLLLNAECLPKQ